MDVLKGGQTFVLVSRTETLHPVQGYQCLTASSIMAAGHVQAELKVLHRLLRLAEIVEVDVPNEPDGQYQIGVKTRTTNLLEESNHRVSQIKSDRNWSGGNEQNFELSNAAARSPPRMLAPAAH